MTDELPYKVLESALVSMVWQFAYRGVKDDRLTLYTGGLSALEEAFDVLGWADPHFIEDSKGLVCEIKECAKWVTCQGTFEGLYLLLCSDHYSRQSDPMALLRPFPEVKEWVVVRERQRDSQGRLPSDVQW